MAFRTLVKNVRVATLVAIVFAIVLKTSESGVTKNILVTTHTGFVSSPNYPNNYPDNTDYNWLFKTHEPGFGIILVFESFKVEFHEECIYDYVAVFDGQTTNDRLLGKFCGYITLPPIKSIGNSMLLQFHSDHSGGRPGFRVMHAAVLDKTHDIYLTQYFLNERQHSLTVNKWGKEITRTAVALFLDDPQFFAAGNEAGEEISYELTLQLMSKLVLKKRISTYDLALYVNAMTVACIDPKSFFGVNIVDELRKRVDNSNQTNPFFLLALCNGGDNMKMEDVHKLQQLFDARLRPSWTDTQAMVVLALKCISRQSQRNLDSTLNEMASELKRKQQTNGTVHSLKTAALVVQAVLATDSYRTDFNLMTAFQCIAKGIKQPYVGTEEFYYVLPILKWKTLLNISSNHCGNTVKTDLEEIVHNYSQERNQVQISIIIGGDMDFSRTWRINVTLNSSLHQVLENISSLELDYKIRYEILEGKPYVAGVGKFQDSTEDGLFWFIFTKPMSSTDDPTLLEESPADITVNEENEMILWYRSGLWPSIQDSSSNSTNAPL